MEETGLINDLSWWVIEEAACQTRLWQRLFPSNSPLGVSVNVSGKLFRSGGVAEKLLSLLDHCGLAPEYLHLEITERSFMDHEDAVLDDLDNLRAAGVQLHIDDFGTGYSSLSYLHRFPTDTLKVDRSFVVNMSHGVKTREIVSTIVILAHKLGMDVIAEGIETESEKKILQDFDCEYGQGYLFAKPLPKKDATELIAQNKKW